LHAIAEAQKLGGVAAFIDAEHAFDAVYARKLGVDIESLLVSQPDTGEQALDIAETLVRSGAIDIIVVDSVAALVPQAEINGEMGDNHVGLQARLMSQALRKLTGILSKSNTCMLFINQLRMKIGVMFGNPETTTGGNALKFYATQRIDIRRIAAIKNGEEVIGNRTRVKIVKNKVAAPFTQCEFDILYGVGISREASILDLACELDIIQKSGSWFSYNNERIGQGRENTRLFLKDNVDLCNEIEQKIRESMKDVELFKLGENDAVDLGDDGEGEAIQEDA
jgi:recombination protein RecA